MKRMRRSIEVDYKDYFEEEDEEGRFVILTSRSILFR